MALGIGVTLEEQEGCGGCKVESIMRNGVAKSEGTLRVGDVIQEVDGVDVKGRVLEDITGLLVGVAGSSVTICGVHAPYSPADEFSAVLVRSGFEFSPANAMMTIQVDELAQEVWLLSSPPHPILLLSICNAASSHAPLCLIC
jgi:C-terminal processing protease CtpA/Prc